MLDILSTPGTCQYLHRGHVKVPMRTLAEHTMLATGVSYSEIYGPKKRGPKTTFVDDIDNFDHGAIRRIICGMYEQKKGKQYIVKIHQKSS